MKSPICYFGGKTKMLNNIVPLLPDTDIYAEPFGGGASVLLAKKPSKIEIYNDLDSSVYIFFKILADENKFEKFKRIIDAAPYSRELYNDCVDFEIEKDEIQKAVKFFVRSRQCFSGCPRSSWSYSKVKADYNIWQNTINRLPEIAQRLKNCYIENNDFRKVFDFWDSADTLFYCDPPYVSSTRKSGGYNHEMTDDDHHDMVSILKNLCGKCILSGYENKLYDSLKWDKKTFIKCCHTKKTINKKRDTRTEILWIKPGTLPQMEMFGKNGDEVYIKSEMEAAK